MFVKDLATLRPRTNSEEFKKHFEPFEKELEINSPPPPPPISQIDDSAVEDVINPPDCGKTKEFLTGGRVVGGRRARNEEFPWQVALMTSRFPQTFGQFTHYCGGTVLNSRWILTAAHCTHNVDLEHLKGMVGTNDIRRPGPKSMEIYFDLSIIHENYTHGEYNNDIALLHTTKSMPMYPNTTAINAACLPQANQAFDGFLTVSGWGRISEEGPRTSRLKTLGVPLQESGNCKQRYKKLFHEDTMLCVGYPRGGKDTCQADSGGPLVKKIDDVSYLAGIVSFGEGCARRKTPGVYTKVSNYIEWIKENMKI